MKQLLPLTIQMAMPTHVEFQLKMHVKRSQYHVPAQPELGTDFTVDKRKVRLAVQTTPESNVKKSMSRLMRQRLTSSVVSVTGIPTSGEACDMLLHH